MRALTDEQLFHVEQDGSPEVRQVCGELRRLYAEEGAREKGEAALFTLLSSAHQQLHAAARTLEMGLRMIAPQEPPKPADDGRRRMPPVMGGSEPTE